LLQCEWHEQEYNRNGNHHFTFNIKPNHLEQAQWATESRLPLAAVSFMSAPSGASTNGANEGGSAKRVARQRVATTTIFPRQHEYFERNGSLLIDCAGLVRPAM